MRVDIGCVVGLAISVFSGCGTENVDAPRAFGKQAEGMELWWEPTDAQRAYAEETGFPLAFQNGQGQKLVLIPPGSFEMGSPGGEAGRANTEGPLQTIDIAQGCFFGAMEITNGAYRRFRSEHSSAVFEDLRLTGETQPVVMVNWDDAQAYCQWLTHQERRAGRLPSGWVYRLPASAEWEYVCRAGSRSAYSFGSSASTLREYGWYDGNSGGLTHPGGQKPANAWGVYDMHGNVFEWCADVWVEEYYVRSSGRDPPGTSWPSRAAQYFVRTSRGKLPVSEMSEKEDVWNRVVRGGSWHSMARYCRSASSVFIPRDHSGDQTGFRVILSWIPES